MGELFTRKKSQKKQKDNHVMSIFYDEFDKQINLLKNRMENGKQRYNEISGIVMQGSQKMHKLCYPTANIECDLKIKNGFYASSVLIDNKSYSALSFVNSDEQIVETYIFDFQQNIYGKKIRINLMKFLSFLDISGKNFNLKDQFQQNITLAQEYFIDNQI